MEIGKLAQQDEYNVHATLRNPISDSIYRSQIHELDISKAKSLEIFLDGLGNYKFERIISFIGKTSTQEERESLPSLQRYYETYTCNLFVLLEHLARNHLDGTSDSQLTALASRSANHASFDIHYSSVKGALVSYVRSLGKQLELPKRIISISSGLIVGSKMYLEMSEDVRNSHKLRSGGTLLNVKQAAKEIWEKSLLSHVSCESGANYLIGTDYP